MIIDAPDHYFDILGPVEGVTFQQADRDLDGIHIFCKTAAEVEAGMDSLKDQIKKNGMIWFSWYKKSAKIPTDVTEDLVRNTALAIGLVDVKVCAVDKQWSALKVVWRKENRN